MQFFVDKYNKIQTRISSFEHSEQYESLNSDDKKNFKIYVERMKSAIKVLKEGNFAIEKKDLYILDFERWFKKVDNYLKRDNF